jgi:hypothetical protein
MSTLPPLRLQLDHPPGQDADRFSSTSAHTVEGRVVALIRTYCTANSSGNSQELKGQHTNSTGTVIVDGEVIKGKRSRTDAKTP